MLARSRITFFAILCLLSAPALADAVPDIHYKDEMGASQTLAAKGAKLTMLHFWATWCAPCVVELPAVDNIAATYGPKGLRVITLSTDTNEDKVKQFFSDHQITHLKPYLDDHDASFSNMKLGGLPATIFINADGKEISRVEGPVKWDDPAVIKFLNAALK